MSLAEVAPVALGVHEGELVVAVQPVSLMDHVCRVEPDALRSLVGDEEGGSRRVPLTELTSILAAVGSYYSKAGGAASNTLRTLAGFGVGAKLLGARGRDEWGAMWSAGLSRAGIDLSCVEVQDATTGRCCILSCQGQRTMRTCMDGAARIGKDDLQLEHFVGARWCYLSAYALYSEGLLERAVELSRAAGCRVALDLGSFEIVGAFRPQLTAVVEGGGVSCVFGNEDEAAAVAGGGAATPEEGLAYLAQHCDVAVVTLGERGCLVKQRRGCQLGGANEGAAAFDPDEVIAQPACSGVEVQDTTGAGDSFAAGFLYSIIRGYTLRRAAEVGCLAGGAVVQALGSEMGPKQWQWLHARLHGERAGEAARSSAAAVQRELLACYALIERRGRGVVYYGSARLRAGSPHYDAARQLGADVARLLGCCSWTGGGPGLMEAATLGAADAGGRVAGIRIAREAGTTVRSASYLPDDAAVVCRFLSSRKVALVDSGVRMHESDRTAFVFLPGGLGTLDELFEVLTLHQLKKLGTRFAVPVIVCNWRNGQDGGGGGGGGFYDGICEWMSNCVALGTVGAPELRDVLVASDPGDVLDALAAHYSVEAHALRGGGRVMRLSEWAERRAAAGGSSNGDLAAL